MGYDLYTSFPCRNKDDVDAIVGNTSLEVQTRIRLLAPALRTSAKDYARTGDRRRGGGYKDLVFADDPTGTPFAGDLIIPRHSSMVQLGLWQPSVPDFTGLPRYSAFLQFQFTLVRPYLSRDDEVFHINDNPVRKDKVFKLPMVAGTGWKGNLRWTMMKTDLEPVREEPEQFAHRRLRHTLLFGTEKGFDTSKDWERFLDHRCATDSDHCRVCRGNNEDEKCRGVREGYRSLLRDHFGLGGREGLPHVAGWLHFFPTFFDCISLEVINPHDRTTRAGKQPIYFESVPVGATGTFSLLYIPFGNVTGNEAGSDLSRVATAISAMMLTYGFSAKKTSGFGEASEGISGSIWTEAGQWPLTNLADLKQEVSHVEWR